MNNPDIPVRKVMSSPPYSVTTDCPVETIAKIMRERDIGFVPVLAQEGLTGCVTDRDLALRVLATLSIKTGKTAADILSGTILSCIDTMTIGDVAAIMGDHQVRRLPVLNSAGQLVGIVSIGDIAERASENLAGEILGEVSETR